MAGDDEQSTMFGEDGRPVGGPRAVAGRVRTREPVREQGRFVYEFPEDSLAVDHPARLMWRVVETMDLSAFLAESRAIEGRQGRDRISVKMLLGLWLYAVSVGVGSAREIARRTQSDAAFRWIVGDQHVGHAKLSEFLVGNRVALEKAFADVLGTLMHRHLLRMDLVAQDGTRVRTSASAPSFRRETSLRECLDQARLHVTAVLSEADDPGVGERIKRLREAKAREYELRVEQAIATLQQVREEKTKSHRKQSGKEPRISTTDPEARIMKMPDGGFRPAYNIQLATAGSELGGKSTIVGVRVTNLGSDVASVEPMLDQIERNTGKVPDVLVADGNHSDHASIRAAAARGVTAIIPTPDRPRQSDKTDDDAPILAWQALMQTEEAKKTYRARAGLCELQNARLKTRFAMAQLLVRGIDKVTCVALMAGLSMNLITHAGSLLAG